jgi:elongation factor G
MTEREKRPETISRTVEIDFTHKKQIGGGGEFARVKIRLEPLPRGTGIQFVNEVRDGAVPKQMIGGVEEGIREAAKTGVLEGGPVVDFKATLIDGAYHETDSNWHTFSLAARGAFRDGMRKAGPKLLFR